MIRQLEPDLYLIDHEFQGVPGTIVSYLLTDGDDLTLIETGPATTMETLLAGVRAAGFDTDRITRLIVTHIHLDHAGGAGSLIQRLPRARLFVHRVGAQHLIDPSKLLASATRIFEEDMERLWGEVLPVPEDRVVVLDDESTLRVGDRVLEALHTPGHASHHLAFHDAERGVIFTSDVAGARLNEAVYCVMEGVAEPEDVDAVMKLGMNHPMGPLALADLIGLDTCLHIMEVLHRGLGDDKYRPCPLLKRYVAAGRLGRKSGRGFYQYE